MVQNVSPTVPSSFSPQSNDIRLNAHTGQGYFDNLLWIPKAIGEFFVHRYADLRMGIRACSSMSSLTSEVCAERVRQVTRLKEAVESSGGFKTAASAIFNRTDPAVKNLFFYVDSRYVQEFVRETDLEKEESIRQEIFRECDRVVCLQNILCKVTSFFRSWCSCMFGTESNPERPAPHAEDREAQFRREPVPSPRAPSGVPVRAPSGRTGAPAPAPTAIAASRAVIPYARNQMPADVRQRAEQIRRLAPLYESMRPCPAPIPDHFECLVSTGIMQIPVFDTSHALNLGNRANRHLIDHTTYEQMLVSSRSEPWPPPCCPQCRHGGRQGMRPEHMRIDVALQCEILAFLETHVPERMRAR
jgi:hypothetical protein